MADSRGLQEAIADKVGRVVAARQDEPPAPVFRHERQEIGEGIAGGRFEEPFHALDQQHLPPLARQDRPEHSCVRRNLVPVQRFVEMGMGEFLRPEAEGEMVSPEDADGVLRDARLPAARGS